MKAILVIVELDDCEVKIREGKTEVRMTRSMRVIDFNDYRPEDRGIWAVFRNGGGYPKLVVRLNGRYDAVKRWVSRNEKDATDIVLETEALVVPDDYGLRKK
jgi:hypothetical protein